ncbi:MAG: YfaZ family outer membrane protein [Campylobacterota bacterium]
MIKKLALATLATTTLLTAQSEVNINVNDEALNLSGALYLNDVYNLDYTSKYYFGAGFLRTSQSGEDNHNLMNLNLKVMNTFPNAKGLTFGMGLKALYLDHSHADMNALALGLMAKYDILPKLNIDASIHYAPKVLTYRDGDSHREFDINLNYAVINNGYVYIGYRDLETKLDHNGEIEYNENPYIGFKFLF